MEKTQLLRTARQINVMTPPSWSNTSVELSPRERLLKDMGETVIEALRAGDIPLPQGGWRVSSLGRQNDVLTHVSFLDGKVATACERYDTQTANGARGRHSRVYGEPVDGSYVPMVIVGDTVARDDLQRREPTLDFAPLEGTMPFHGQQVLSRDVLEGMGALSHMADASELWWAPRKATLQLARVLFVQVGEQILRVHVCEDKINKSGLSLLVWSADGELLEVDDSGKAVWGITLTNSLSHRPGANWVQLGR